MITWEEKYLQKAEELQKGVWTSEDRATLRTMLFNKTLHRAVGLILLENADLGSQLLNLNLGTQENIVVGAKIQGQVAGAVRFTDRLLELAKAHGDE